MVNNTVDTECSFGHGILNVIWVVTLKWSQALDPHHLKSPGYH